MLGWIQAAMQQNTIVNVPEPIVISHVKMIVLDSPYVNWTSMFRPYLKNAIT